MLLSAILLQQVLPVNDTCVYNMWWDSYPYSSLSVHALHPQYLALRATLDDLPGVSMPTDTAAAIEAARVSGSNCCSAILTFWRVTVTLSLVLALQLLHMVQSMPATQSVESQQGVSVLRDWRCCAAVTLQYGVVLVAQLLLLHQDTITVPFPPTASTYCLAT
jgi:hypothetical protein